jgi:signal transduction histidine kinase
MDRGTPNLGWYSRQGYFSKFVFAFVALVVLVLAINGLVETWFTYRKTTQVAAESQSEKAQATAKRVEQFTSSVERQISWATRASSTTLEQRRADYALLLQQVPEIDRLIYLDNAGKEQLRLTRQEIVFASGLDYSGDPRFKEARGKLVWWSPVYFNERDPFIAIALAHSGLNAGSTVAEINLKFLADLVDRDQISSDTEAYIVDDKARLIADSSSSRLLGTDLSNLPQVAALINPTGQVVTIGKDPENRSVLSGSAAIPARKWYVFFDKPLSVVLEPVYSLLFRTASLLALCVLIGVLAAIWLARRLVSPIRDLQTGARQLESSHFDYRIDVRTSDEIGELSEQFNRMADQIQTSYEGLEQKVAERTKDLAQSNSELRALEEIGRSVVSSLDIQAVLTTIVKYAAELSHADAGAIYNLDPAQRVFQLAEAYGLEESYKSAIRSIKVGFDEGALGLSAEQRKPVAIPDLAKAPNYPLKDVTLAAGFRSVLVVPLPGRERVLGALVLLRRAAEEFSANTIALMQTFGDQSALAMNNARLFREVEQKGQELALASEHKSQFFANMSHELRTPLNAVLGYSELLADGLYGDMPEKAGDILERVKANGKHLLGLINDVLDLSKIEAGQLTLALEDYSVENMVQSVVASTGSLASAKGIDVKTDIAEKLPIGHGDERRLTQVLVNLISNAIKFTDTGSIDVSVKAENDQFNIAVTDTGPGIAPEDREKIFEEFHQVDNSSTRKKGGTGLGLSISRRLIDMHGGCINVESTVGVGSTFRVIIPVRVNEQRQ